MNLSIIPTLLLFCLSTALPEASLAQGDLEGRNYSGKELAERFAARDFKGVPYRFIEPLQFKKGEAKK